MAEHDANREPQPIDEEAAWAAIVAGYGEEPADPPGAKPFKSVEDLALLEGERNGTRPGADAPDGLDGGPGGPDGPDGLDAGKKASEPPGLLKPPMPPASTLTPNSTSTPASSLTPALAADAPAGSAGDGAKNDGDDQGGQKADTGDAADTGEDSSSEAGKPVLGGSITFAPGVGGPGIALPGAGGPRDYRLAEPEDGNAEDEEGHFVPPEPPPLPESDVTARFAWLAVIGGPVLMLVAVLLSWDMTWWLTTLCIGGFLGGFATLVARMDPDDDESDDPGRGAVV
ncbi:hypothetical protein ACIBJC_24320 [Streptomyces sp. NPDC050509]|uniref:hypothetical protein n=1 Tax=Streptomyces sp. NPDC050509 TaxID=3365620 RepID=UPI00379460F9